MLRRRVVIPGLAVVVLMAGAVAHADVVEPYIESGPAEAYEAACLSGGGYEPVPHGDRSYFVHTCAQEEDADGDGLVDLASVSFYTHTCTATADTLRCIATQGYKHVDPAQVNVDLDAGTAMWNAEFTDCPVAADLTATGEPFVGNPEPWSFGWPRPRLYDLTLQLGSLESRTSSDVDATGTATVCGHTVDEDASGWMDRSSSERLEAGLRLKPEDTPVLGGAIDRGEQVQNRHSADFACASWRHDSAGSHTFVASCGSRRDGDDDGIDEDAIVDVLHTTCDETTCNATFTEAWVDVSQVEIDVDGGTAAFAATLEGCGSSEHVDLAFADPGPIRTQSESAEHDAVALEPATGRVIHGHRDDTTWRGRDMSLVPGWDVCGHPEVEAQPWSAVIGDQTWQRTERYVGIDPGALAP